MTGISGQPFALTWPDGKRNADTSLTFSASCSTAGELQGLPSPPVKWIIVLRYVDQAVQRVAEQEIAGYDWLARMS